MDLSKTCVCWRWCSSIAFSTASSVTSTAALGQWCSLAAGLPEVCQKNIISRQDSSLFKPHWDRRSQSQEPVKSTPVTRSTTLITIPVRLARLSWLEGVPVLEPPAADAESAPPFKVKQPSGSRHLTVHSFVGSFSAKISKGFYERNLSKFGTR